MNKSLTIIIRRLQKIEVFIVALLIFGSINLSFAQDIKVDIVALTEETQKIIQSRDELAAVWWIPEEYWRVSFKQKPNMTEAKWEEFIKFLRPYTVFFALEGKVGTFGGVTYKSEATIKNSIQMIDSQGTHYRPLGDEKIDANTKNLLSMMKPILGNMLGPMGQNLHFFLFPSLSKNGKKIADAKKEGTFSVMLDKKEFKWRLPLSSVIPPKVCPVDGEKMSGAWKFCPWHGVKLK